MDEIAEAVELTTERNKNEEEQKILKSIVEFSSIDVKEIMKSRVDVIAIEQDLLFEKVIELVVNSGFSRIPVFKEKIDNSCLLCSEDKPHHCHRRLVAEYLAGKWPNVEIVHL